MVLCYGLPCHWKKCLLSNSAVAWHNGKDRSSFVGASVLSTKKSSTGGGVILYSTHAACFLRLVTSFSRRIYYVTFYEESYRERYVGNSTRRLNACDCLLQDFQSRCPCFEFQFDLYVGIKQMFFVFCSFFERHS